MNKGGGEGVG